MTRLPRTVWWADYAEFLASPEWQVLRAGAMQRAGGRCERCGRAAQQVHHKTYARAMGKERPDDLEAICWPCHQKHHKKPKPTAKVVVKTRKKKRGGSSRRQVRKAMRALHKATKKKGPRSMSVWTMDDTGNLRRTP